MREQVFPPMRRFGVRKVLAMKSTGSFWGDLLVHAFRGLILLGIFVIWQLIRSLFTKPKDKE